jgi:hypothetical protein
MFPIYNLWDADVLGDGINSGMMLTAYLDWEDEGMDSSKFISVSVGYDDYCALADDENTDDEWHYPSSPKYNDLAQLLIMNLIKKGN